MLDSLELGGVESPRLGMERLEVNIMDDTNKRRYCRTVQYIREEVSQGNSIKCVEDVMLYKKLW